MIKFAYFEGQFACQCAPFTFSISLYSFRLRSLPSQTGVSTVTIIATDPGSLSATTTFTLTVNPAPVVGASQLTVSHQDATFGQLNSNTIKPFLQLANTGQTSIPYSAITVRYWLTVEGDVPITIFENYYVQLGPTNVHARYVGLATPLRGASGYVEYRFDGGAGSLSTGSHSGPIQSGFTKQDYSGFGQGDDYSYALNRDYVLNPNITAYVNGSLVYGTEPVSGGRLIADERQSKLSVHMLGNPVEGKTVEVEIRGVEGQRVNLELVDLNGRLLQVHRLEQAKALERVNLEAGSLPNQFILQVSAAREQQVIKVLKP